MIKKAIIFSVVLVLILFSVTNMTSAEEEWKQDLYLFQNKMMEDVVVTIDESLTHVTIKSEHDLTNVRIVSSNGENLVIDKVSKGETILKLTQPMDEITYSLMAFEAYDLFADVSVKLEGKEHINSYNFFFNVSRYMKPNEKFEYFIYANDELVMELGESSDLYRSVRIVELTPKPSVETGDIIRLEISREAYDFPMDYVLEVTNGDKEETLPSRKDGIYEFTVEGTLSIHIYEKDFIERDKKIRASMDDNGYLLDPHTMKNMDDLDSDIQVDDTQEKDEESPVLNNPNDKKNNKNGTVLGVGLLVVTGVVTSTVFIFKKRRKI